MTPERLEHARHIVETVVREQMSDIVFHKILVIPDLEKYDDDDLDYLRVRAIYEGEHEQLRPGRSLDLLVALRRRLCDEGITEFPVLFMTMKSEWDERPDPA